jgi:hypothetical protein
MRFVLFPLCCATPQTARSPSKTSAWTTVEFGQKAHFASGWSFGEAHTENEIATQARMVVLALIVYSDVAAKSRWVAGFGHIA